MTTWSPADGGRSYLRALPVLQGSGPPIDIRTIPADPVVLFASWLQDAVAAGVPEPHAMTLSTVDANNQPRARMLILKAVDERGWHFAVSAVSQKGRDLAGRPSAALTFYWPALVRQVRVVGAVVDDGADASAEDFLARPAGSRAMALTLRQSEPLLDPAELDAEIDKARRKLDENPGLVPDEWTSYAVAPGAVEFWQGSPDRRHWRLSYQRGDDGWDRTRLWP